MERTCLESCCSSPRKPSPSPSSLVSNDNANVIHHVLKTSLTTVIIVILAFMNSNLHDLVKCLMVPQHVTHVSSAPIVAPPPSNCSTRTFDFGTVLRMDICRYDGRPVIDIYMDNAMLRSFEGDSAVSFTEWVYRCTTSDPLTYCPLRSTVQCPHYTAFGSDSICLSLGNLTAKYMELNGHRFKPPPSFLHYVSNAYYHVRD